MRSELVSLARQFRLMALHDDCSKDGFELENEAFLLKVLRREAKFREEKAAADRLKRAKFPSFKSFDDFDTDFQKGVTRKQLETLASLDWLDSLFNLILIGPPGTGKTHIALAIGNKAVNDGYKAAFVRMDNLIHVLKTAEISRKSRAPQLDS